MPVEYGRTAIPTTCQPRCSSGKTCNQGKWNGSPVRFLHMNSTSSNQRDHTDRLRGLSLSRSRNLSLCHKSQVRGWYNYYNKFGKTEFEEVMNHLNVVLAYWVHRKYKHFHRKPIVKAFIWFQEITKKDRRLFFHWHKGYTPRVCLCTTS